METHDINAVLLTATRTLFYFAIAVTCIVLIIYILHVSSRRKLLSENRLSVETPITIHYYNGVRYFIKRDDLFHGFGSKLRKIPYTINPDSSYVYVKSKLDQHSLTNSTKIAKRLKNSGYDIEIVDSCWKPDTIGICARRDWIKPGLSAGISESCFGYIKMIENLDLSYVDKLYCVSGFDLVVGCLFGLLKCNIKNVKLIAVKCVEPLLPDLNHFKLLFYLLCIQLGVNWEFPEHLLEYRREFFGSYGTPTPEGTAAQNHLIAEGIILDHKYSAKCFACLFRDISMGDDSNSMIIHSYGRP